MAAAKLTASSVTSSSKSGEYKIRFRGKGKSDAWKEFGLVVDHNGNELDFAACISCHQALAYSSCIGTSALKCDKYIVTIGYYRILL